jgi:hypothetical protein
MHRKWRLISESAELLSSAGKLWLLPLIVAMLVIGGAVLFAQGSALAPFIYTLF